MGLNVENNFRTNFFRRIATKLGAFVDLVECFLVVPSVLPYDLPFWGNLGGSENFDPKYLLTREG